MDTPKMSLKLLVDRKGSRVLFAEAPKEFVDFLFRIFSISFGTLLEFDQTVGMGSLGKLKDSIQSFQQNYLQPGIKVDDIFNPKTPSWTASQVYKCSKTSCGNGTAYGYNSKPCECRYYASMHVKSYCPCCGFTMDVPMKIVKPDTLVRTNEADKNKLAGYVKEVVTYMVMDDLVVKPMSTISSITLLNKCGVNDLSHLEERTVSFGKEEGMKLLNASLKTDKVLTTIFMT